MTPYQQGFQARMALADSQLAIGRSPYRRSDVDHARWRSGWLDASQQLSAKRANARRLEVVS